jgi:quercetin dioxygenase-like cupin family protein
MNYPVIIENLPTIDIPLKGAEGFLLQGSDNQLVFFDFKEDAEIPMHSHGAQWGIVVDGKIDLTIGGVKRTYTKGDSYSIPAGTVHGGKVYAGFKAIDFFEDRARYKTR